MQNFRLISSNISAIGQYILVYDITKSKHLATIERRNVSYVANNKPLSIAESQLLEIISQNFDTFFQSCKTEK